MHDVLEMGQDPLDIKNLENEDELIESAKDYALKGVEDEMNRLLGMETPEQMKMREMELMDARDEMVARL